MPEKSNQSETALAVESSDLLASSHPYYCSESNYYSRDGSMDFETLGDFLDSFEDADLDMNLCFRWDIKLKDEDEPEKGYYAQVFLMLQRKGIFRPIEIDTVNEDELPRFNAYLSKHWNHMKKIWSPYSGS